MSFSEKISNRIREALSETENDVEEKHMFGGLCFMVNDKMCIGVVKDEMMCRIDPEKQEALLEKTGCREMDFSGRPMKGFIYVDENGMKTKTQFNSWIKLCLDFNPRAKSSKKKK